MGTKRNKTKSSDSADFDWSAEADPVDESTLLARGASADPISVAIAGGHDDLSLLEKMYAKGADLNRNSGAMYCPSALVHACQHGRLRNVKWLIERGAEPMQTSA
jgi:hypothetical protein